MNAGRLRPPNLSDFLEREVPQIMKCDDGCLELGIEAGVFDFRLNKSFQARRRVGNRV